MNTLKQTAGEVFNKTLHAMKPENLIGRAIKLKGNTLTIQKKKTVLEPGTPIYVIGAGKAAVQMALGLEKVLGNRIKDGIVIAPHRDDSGLEFIQVFEGSHPRPDENSVASTLELTAFARSIPENAFVFVLISGGASALMEVPEDPLSLEDVSEAYNILLKSGATIQEMNTVRRELSAVKGGKLLGMLKARNAASLIISDVPGDDPAYIASGPTTLPGSGSGNIKAIAKKYGLFEKFPEAVTGFLESGNTARVTQPETSHSTFIVGSSGLFASEAARLCKEAGFTVFKSESQYTEDAKTVSKMIIEDLRKQKSGKRAHIFHGESTVHVTGDGKGGRNQHLALLLAKGISRRKNTVVLSAGTDGVDGNTDVAGAFATSDTVKRASALGMEADTYLKNFDSYRYFKSLGDLIFTGPTGNNVMDFQLILIDT